jgi:hypothetical protein
MPGPLFCSGGERIRPRRPIPVRCPSPHAWTMDAGIRGLDGLLDLLDEVAANQDAADEQLYTDGCAAALLLEAERRRVSRRLRAVAAEGPGAHAERVGELRGRLEEIVGSIDRLRRMLRRMGPPSRRAPTRFRSRDPRDPPAAAFSKDE